MSITTYVKAVFPDTEHTRALLEIYEACRKHGVTVPDEVSDMFDGSDEYMSSLGTVKDVSSWHGEEEMTEWILVTLSDVPKGATAIAFITTSY